MVMFRGFLLGVLCVCLRGLCGFSGNGCVGLV